ncbi:sodium/nucleoside cotransporter 1 isoform X2 [Harpegnathos saltator]|uniref:Sodium/nucleoside cotransporter n=1 Tax=Harpegnathos saltator TaxID=610380 RepID=E2C0T8_HARSA|nr:sodium/nucleoside cotransporter 1 isoform X2 [Harpegnathos saltator]EFN78482.1 Solute carrier family 28 member 3 [Harpegnathos saltator]
MSGRVNQAFYDNELEELESGRRKSETNANQDVLSRHEKPEGHRAAKKEPIEAFLSKNRRVIKICGVMLLNLLILAYIIYAGIYWKNSASGRRCEFGWCGGYGMLLIIVGVVYVGLVYFLIVKRYFGKRIAQRFKPMTSSLVRLRDTKLVTRFGATIFYLIVFIVIITFLVIDTADSRERLVSGLGVIVILGLGLIFSKHPRQINWSTVILGLFLQFTFGLITIRWEVGRSVFQCVSGRVAIFLDFAKAGARFVFSEDLVNKGVFAFSVLPVIFFFSFIVQVLSYLGAMQWIILKLGWILQRVMGTTLCESICAVANPFIGMSESPLLIAPYLNKLTSSEIHAIICSGFSTVSGSILAAYIAFGAQPVYLITASVMSAPASLCYSKLFYPELEQSQTKFENMKLEKSSDTSILGAATNGALAALPIILGIIANIVAFVSFIAFFNALLSWFGGLVGYEALSLEIILAKVFMPLSWVMGVPWEHCEDVGTLIGLKTVINELVAYQRMGEYKMQGRIYGRAETIATFALCGFANPSAIGIMIGCLSSLAPEKKEQVTSVVVRAFFAGSAVCFLTASIAGMLVENISLSNSTVTMITNNTAITTPMTSVL